MKQVRMAVTITFSPGKTLEALKEDKGLEAMLALLYHQVQSMAYEDFVEDTKIWHQIAGQFQCEESAPQEVIDDLIEKCDRSMIFQMDVDKARVMLTHPNTLQAMLTTFASVMGTDRKEFEVDPDAVEEIKPESEPH